MNLAIDIGNVICHIKFEPFLKHLSKFLNISYSDGMHFLNRVQKLHDLGLTNLKDELADHFKIKSESLLDELLSLWDKCLQLDCTVLQELEKLRKKHGIEIALLSNIGFEHAKYIRDSSNLYPILNSTIQFFSCEVGARKPTYLYYHTFLQMYPQFKNCIYIDDLDDNLSAGKQMGFNSQKFKISDYKKSNLEDLMIGGGQISLYFQNIEKLLSQ